MARQSGLQASDRGKLRRGASVNPGFCRKGPAMVPRQPPAYCRVACARPALGFPPSLDDRDRLVPHLADIAYASVSPTMNLTSSPVFSARLFTQGISVVFYLHGAVTRAVRLGVVMRD